MIDIVIRLRDDVMKRIWIFEQSSVFRMLNGSFRIENFFFFFSMRENKREFLGRFIDNNGILFDMQDKICRNVQFYYDSKWYFSFVGISFVSEVTKDGLLSFFTRLPSISFFQRTWKDDYYYYSSRSIYDQKL